jgi:hypothetical protein
MLLYKKNDKESIIFTSDINGDLNRILYTLNCFENGGKIKDGVSVQYSALCSIESGGSTQQCNKITTPKETIYVMNDSSSFNFSSPHSLIQKLREYGNNTIVKIYDRSFMGGFSTYKTNAIQDDKGNIISFKDKKEDADIPLLHKFIQYMKMNNGRMIIPLISKYVNTLSIVGKKRSLIVGYANVQDYLKIIKEPNGNFIKMLREENKDDYIVELGPKKQMKLVISNIVDNKISIDLYIDGTMKKDVDVSISDIYILLNTRPIVLQNQNLPYFINTFNSISVFITPLILTDTKMLTNLRGGMNLLR